MTGENPYPQLTLHGLAAANDRLRVAERALPTRAGKYRHDHRTQPQYGNGDSSSRSNQGCRSPADRAFAARIFHRPSRSGAWRTADGGRAGGDRSRAMHGILRQLVKASVKGEKPDE